MLTGEINQLLLVSEDLATEMGVPKDSLPAEHTFEGIPLKIDKSLPRMTAIYVPEEPLNLIRRKNS